MKIDGRAIADRVLQSLKKTGKTPTLAIIQVGDNDASTTYINQKKIAAEKIGARVIHKQFPKGSLPEEIKALIEEYNGDPSIHGLILQRPLEAVSLYQYISPQKDVDGFLPSSPYMPPVAAAVLLILNEMNAPIGPCVVIGRGETAGKPIADTLTKHGWSVAVVHSQTKNMKDIIKNARVVVSCVGKEHVITRDMVNDKTILIGVGLWRDENGKLRGDYDEDDIKNVVSSYTPTPGGVGPVNVACLMQNVVAAAKNSY